MTETRRAGARDLAIVAALALVAVSFWKLRIIDPAESEPFKRSLANVDYFTYILPSAVGVSRELLDGDLPLWNPFQASGHPMLASVAHGALYPLNFAFLVLPAHLAIEATVVLHLFLAGLLMYLFARGLRLGWLPAATAALAFMLSGFVSMRAGWFTPALAACAWLPLALLSVEKIFERPRALWMVPLALAVAMPVLAGWLQIWTYSMYAIAIYAGIRMAGSLASVGPRQNARIASLLAGGVALGIGLAAVQLLPSLELQDLSLRRSGTVSARQTLLFGATSPGQLLAWATQSEPGPPRWIYLGMPTLVLIPLAFFCRGRALAILSLWCMLVLGLGVALTIHSPIYALFVKLPTGNMFRTPQRMLYLYTFAGSALAGVAVHALSTSQTRARRWICLGVAIATAAALCLAVHISALGLAYLWGAVVAIAGALWLPAPRLRFAALIGLVGILAVDVFFATSNPFKHPYHVPELRLQERAIFEYLRANQGLDRTYLRANRLGFDLIAKHATLERIYSITDYEPLSLVRQANLVRLIDRRDHATFDRRPFMGWLDADPTSPHFDLFDLMSVRYAVVHKDDAKFQRELAARPGGWKKVFVPARGNHVVYENPRPLPRAYVASKVVPASNGEEALEAVARADFDPRRSVVIEGRAGASSALARESGGPITPAHIVRYQAAEVAIEADAAHEGYLVLTDTFYPGWQATVDGRSVPIERANYLYRAVLVGPGRHEIVFRYVPTAFRAGAALTLMALFALAACMLWAPIARWRLHRGALSTAALLTVLLAAGCGQTGKIPAPTNVLIFVVDTLRRDHLGVYGYPRDVSPATDALAREGVVFDRVATAAPRTWQSFTSILTGRYPPRHGVRYIFSPPLDRQIPTMGSVLAAHGYQTVAFDGMNFLRGMTAGAAFQDYRDPVTLPGGSMLGDSAVMEAFEAWLQAAQPPFFAFLRLTAPHWLYLCDPVFHDEVEDHEQISHAFNRGNQGLGLDAEGLSLTDAEAYHRLFYEFDYSPREREHMILHYDECVHASDVAIGRGIARLRSLGWMESTIVVVTSDHGESFGEHGYRQHGPRVDRPVIDVPLIMRFPEPLAAGRRGVRVEQLVRTVDVFPTVLSAMGLEYPADLDGRSLLPAIDEQVDLRLEAYAEGGRAFVGVDDDIHLPGVAGKHRMIQDLDWKLVYVPDAGPGSYRLYDLEADPGETRDVADAHPEVVARLRRSLEEAMRESLGAGPERELSDEEKQRLRALGYL